MHRFTDPGPAEPRTSEPARWGLWRGDDGRVLGPVAVIGVAVVVALLLAFVFWRVESWPGRIAGSVQDTFQEVFHFDPQVTVDEDVIIEQATDIAELAVTERVVVVERGFENSWLLSTKRLRARGTYTAKAGFDLTALVNVDIDKKAKTMKVVFPEPQILSVEQQSLEILEWDNGLWNRLNAADTEAAVNEMATLARERATQQGIAADARASVTETLVPLLEERTGLQVEVSFD